MGLFERYLSLWVALCIVSGIALGTLLPGVFQIFADLEYASVNLPIAVLIWLMIYPMMVQVDFEAIRDVGKRPKGFMLTLVVNWPIKPFTMAGLGWLFFRVLFVDLVDPATASEYIAGMILLGVAPCTAMVFVWSQLTRGDANYTLVQVSVNDVIMIFAFAPIAASPDPQGWIATEGWRHRRSDADTALRICPQPQYTFPHPAPGWRLRVSRQSTATLSTR